MTEISVVINTINEEENLPEAIKSVKDLASEIVVVDMKSDDDTQKIAKKLGAKVFEHKRMGYVEPARNFAISKATGDWIFILDADERISPKLKKTIQKIVTSDEADYYRLPRKNIVFGKWLKHSRWWPDYNIRLFKKGYVEWNEIIHSVPITAGKGLDIEAREENAIVHYHYDNLDQYIERMNRYTTHQAEGLLRDGYNFVWQDLITKPSGEFLSRFFQGEGYKDGVHGLALAGLQAFSEFVLYLKVWQAEKFKSQKTDLSNIVSEMKKVESDIHYWQADAFVKEKGGLLNRIRRKYKL